MRPRGGSTPEVAPASAADEEGRDHWARVVIELSNGSELVTELLGLGRPDLEVIDALAGAQLALRRSGGRLRLEAMQPALAELLELCGLLREVGGEAEGGEDDLGVQEGVDLGDPPA